MKGKMINLKTLITTLVGAFILYLIGFFVEFQLMKSKFDAMGSEIEVIKQDVDRIEEVKSVQCEMALFLMDDNKKVAKICNR